MSFIYIKRHKNKFYAGDRNYFCMAESFNMHGHRKRVLEEMYINKCVQSGFITYITILIKIII